MKTLYEPSFEHDNCGIGAVVNIDGSKSHKIVDNALSIVEKLEHRAGKDASGETGDGVGILVQISHDFFKKEAADLVGKLGEREYGIGQFFFPCASDTERSRSAEAEKSRFEACVKAEGLKFLGWRKVPVNADVLGKKARDCMPEIWQGFIEKPADCEKGIEFDRKLYILRREFEKASKVVSTGSTTDFSNVLRKMYKRLSNSIPVSQSAGFSTKPCQISGMQSRAFLPRTSAFTGTLRQPRNLRPSAFTQASKRTFSASALRLRSVSEAHGKKNWPIPYSLSPSFPIRSAASFLKKS